ncbi:MAG: PepSY domain-containing protein, partial [Alphaproteobacteria bacterium]|nr:PepSY domain-containing protein [Alphaproteobacteria bacterium]
MLKKCLAPVLLSLAMLAPTIAMADDRPPTAEERTAIETKLTELGFTKWEEIELDDGKWEIDDALHNDGKKYDVDLAPQSLNLLKKEL